MERGFTEEEIFKEAWDLYLNRKISVRFFSLHFRVSWEEAEKIAQHIIKKKNEILDSHDNFIERAQVLMRNCKISAQINYNKRNNSLLACQRKKSIIDLSKEEKSLIRDFYENCPEGFEVDHIIPVAKGGKHQLANLQYLEKDKNRKKGTSLVNENLEWPCCPVPFF